MLSFNSRDKCLLVLRWFSTVFTLIFVGLIFMKIEKSNFRDFIFAVAQDFCKTCTLSKFGVAPRKLFVIK